MGKQPSTVLYSEPVTLVGGGNADEVDLSTAVALAPRLIAADGGASVLFEWGMSPERVIGDMDSISGEAREAFADIIETVAEQVTTDFEKCLERIDADRVIAVGFRGGRLDHELAVLNSLAKHKSRKIVLLGGEDVCVCIPVSGLSFDLPIGTRLSVMPLATCRVWSKGLRWKLSGEEMQTDGFMSASNEVAGPVTLRAEGPALLICPREALDVVWAALA